MVLMNFIMTIMIRMISFIMMMMISAMILMLKCFLSAIDFATVYSTRYSDFLSQPYSNPTRSQKTLLAGAWSWYTCVWCSNEWCMYLWSSILDPNTCMYDAYIYDPWSRCLCVWWSCMMIMYDPWIYDHPYLTLMLVCVMHVKNGDEQTNERTEIWILGVGLKNKNMAQSQIFPILLALQ